MFSNTVQKARSHTDLISLRYIVQDYFSLLDNTYIYFPSSKTTHHLKHLNTDRVSEALHLTSSRVRRVGITNCKKIQMTALYNFLERDIGSFAKTGQPF